MATPLSPPSTTWSDWSWQPLPQSIPILYEDEGQEEMGEANLHVKADEILHVCLCAHFRATRPEYQVFSNMNLYYLDEPVHPQTGSMPYVSPDTMVVKAFALLPEETRSYKIGQDGPPPLASIEILSARSAQQRDLKEKMVVYRMLKVPEYILVDESGKYLRERLLLKRLGADGQYHDERDADGGVTSQLGFRIILDKDGLRVIDAATGYRYVRPMEAEQEAKARLTAEAALRSAEEQRARDAQARLQAETQLAATQERLRRLEEELARLKQNNPS